MDALISRPVSASAALHVSTSAALHAGFFVLLGIASSPSAGMMAGKVERRTALLVALQPRTSAPRELAAPRPRAVSPHQSKQTESSSGGPASRTAESYPPTGNSAPTGVSAPGDDSNTVLAGNPSYYSLLMSEVSRHKFYPRAALARGDEGSVSVAFQIESDGSIRDVRIHRASASEVLNEAASHLISSIRRLPPPPDSLPSPLRIVLPVTYTLRSV